MRNNKKAPPQSPPPPEPADTTTPIFFWRESELPYGFLSQWYPSTFTSETNLPFTSAEQYMMYSKALLAHDIPSQKQILASPSPGEQKTLGRAIKTLDNKVYEKSKFEIVVRGNMFKFAQNEALKGLLEGTGERELVEASPSDRVWGIGFVREEAEGRRGEWGENLLGKALMTVRERLRGKDGEKEGV